MIAPMLASPGDESSATEPGRWHFEVKWDGYRALATVADGAVTLWSRNGLDLTAAYPELGELGPHLVGHSALLDGEVVALRPDGRSSFELLQNHARGGVAHLMLFDLLELDGLSLLELPYTARRELLVDLVGDGTDHVHVPTTFGTDRETALLASKTLKLEGLIAKRADSPYQPGRRSPAWVKIRNTDDVDVVVVGWAPGSGARARTVGALLVAVRDEDGELAYAGRVGSGFTDAGLDEALALLVPLEAAAPAVGGIPRADAKDAHWVEPVLTGEVSHTEWSSSGRLRHPVWRGFTRF